MSGVIVIRYVDRLYLTHFRLFGVLLMTMFIVYIYIYFHFTFGIHDSVSQKI